MAITLASNFDQTAAVPLDSRTVVADTTARDAIASGVRYEGLTVYVTADAKNYQLIGGITNGDWTELQGAGGGGINYILTPDGADITGWSTYFDDQAVTFTDAGDLVNLTAHGLSNGQVVSFTSITSTTGISVNTAYYVVGAATNTFQVSATSGGSALTLTTDGSGTLVIDRPLNGTGGSPSSTFAISTDSSLVGTENFLWTKSANNRMSEGFSYAFSIDQAYQSKPMTISALYKVASGSYADNDISIWVYDVTNAVLIQPSAYQIKNSTGVEQLKCEFQAASNSTSYRLIFHTASTSASAYTLRFDSFSVSPNTYNAGAVVTDWKLETGFTFNGLGTVTGTSVWVRREGDKVKVRGITTAGTVAASTCSIQPPTYLTLDSSKFASTTNAQDVGTFFTRRGSSAAIYNGGLDGVAFYDGTTTNLIFLAQTEGGTSGQFTKANGSTLFATGSGVSFSFEYPVLGWGTSQVLSSETSTSVVAASYYASSATFTPGADTPLNFDSKLYDTHSAVTTGVGTWRYTAPVPGVYSVYVMTFYSSGTGGYLYLWLNGVKSYLGSPATSATQSGPITVDVSLRAGDYIDVRPSTGMTLLGGGLPYQTYITVKRLSGPAQIAASEKVYLKYTGNAGGAITANVTNVDFTTKVVDSHGSWSGTTFTAPRPSWYDVNGSWNCTTGAAKDLQMYINGSAKEFVSYNTTGSASSFIMFSGGAFMNAGDTMTMRSDTSATLSNSATLHWLSIRSQG